MHKVINFKNSKGLNLVGWLDKKSKDSVIILSHGLTDDKSSHGRYDKLAKAIAKKGLSVFRFDFSGFGQSDDTNSTIKKQIDDLKCAIKAMKKLGFKKFGLMGHSLGGYVSIGNYSKDIKTMVFWAPATKAKDYSKERLTPEQTAEIKEKGYFTFNKPKRRWKKIMRFDARFIKERNMINQKKDCSNVKCPVLIIHGDCDDTTPLDNSKSALRYFPKNSKLEVLKGEDHNFFKELDKAVKLTTDWFISHLE